MITRIIEFSTLLDKYKRLNINYIKLNSLSILSAIRYAELLTTLIDKGFEVINLSTEYGIEVIQTPRFAWEKFRRTHPKRDTMVYGAGSLWKLSTHLLKGTLSPKPKEVYLVEDTTLLVTRTGRINVNGLFLKEHNQLITELLDVKHTAFTEDLLRVISDDKEILKYIVVFFNSSFGYDLSNIAWFGALQPHLDPKIIEKIPIPLAPVNLRNKTVDLLISAYKLEIKAWRAYFKAMKIVGEYLKPTLVKITGTSRLVIAKNAGRLDGAGLLAFGLLEEIAKYFGKSIKLYNVFEIKSGNVPRSKDYKGVSGIPYITIDSIDDIGIVDEEKMAFIPREKYKRLFTKTRNHDILLVKDGIGSLGKVAVTLGEYPVMSGIFILRGKAIENELLYYIVTILKTRFYRKLMEMMSYGTTGQISLTKRVVENILIPILDNYKEIGGLFKEFIENMYQANVLKRQAIMELENYILKLLG